MKDAIWVVDDQFYCRAFDTEKYFNVKFEMSLRTKGYLSGKFKQLSDQWAQMGMRLKLEKLKASLRQINVTSSLKIESMGALKDPGKIQLWSTVGLVALFSCLLALSLFLVQLFQFVYLSKDRIKHRLRNFYFKVYFCITRPRVQITYIN